MIGCMNTPPFGQPHGGPHPNEYGGPYHGYVAPRAGVSAGARNALAACLAIFAVLAIGGTILSVESEKKANYMVFDGDPALRARVDGKDVGALVEKEAGTTKGLVVELTPGAHTIEILDAQGAVVEKGKVSSVPPRGYRALYAVGEQNGYAFVQVGYGETVKGEPVTPMRAEEPHVYVVPAGTFISKKDLANVNEPFPKSVYTKNSYTRERICRLDSDGKPGCL
jgi:hypothetical protein